MCRRSDHVEVRLCIVVTSDSVAYGLKKDEVCPSAQAVVEELGGELLKCIVVPNSVPIIVNEVRDCLKLCNFALITGGTGVSEHDLSTDVVKQFEGIELPELGELLRVASYSTVGVRAFASRSIAKLVKYPRPALIAAIPGNPNAIRFALRILLEDYVPHILFEFLKKSAAQHILEGNRS